MTIPDTDGAPLTSLGIHEVVDTFIRSTTENPASFSADARLASRVQARKARWATRLAQYLIRIAGEIDRLHRLLEEQGQTIARLQGVPNPEPGEHAHRTREERDACMNGACNGEITVNGYTWAKR